MKNTKKTVHLKAFCAALLPLVLFACAGRGPMPPAATPPAAPPSPPPPPPPPLVTLDTASLEADLGRFIPHLMKEARIPGLQIAVIRDGRIAFHQNFGIRNAAFPDSPVTDDTVFEAASLTKPFFAYYVMKLIDRGFLDLDKPLP